MRSSCPPPARLVLLAALLLTASAPWVRAHPLHTSFAEADYRPATNRLEVALRVFADDLEAALSAAAGRRISLTTTPADEFNALVQAYTTRHFTVRPAAGTPATLQWVGRELKDRDNEVWLYFELALPGGIEGARIRHALLEDSFPSQINTVRVRDGKRQATLVFFPERAEKVVVFSP